jgi:hypothetical protein
MKRLFISVFLISFIFASCSKNNNESKSIGKGRESEIKKEHILALSEQEHKPPEEYVCVGEWDEKTIGTKLDVPKGIAMDKEGSIYVASLWAVDKISPDGKLVMKINWKDKAKKEGGLPKDVALDSKGNIYVCCGVRPKIWIYSPDGKLLKRWGKYGYDEGEFDLLEAIAIDSKDYVYVAGTSKYQVQKFTSDGRFVSGIGKPGVPFFGKPGKKPGEFYDAVAIAIDSKDNIYVADKPNYRVQKFTSDGRFITMWGRQGRGDGEFFRGPIAIAIDSEDYVYVVDFEGDIQKFTSDGKFVTRFGESENGYISAIVINTKGNVYACFIDYINKNDRILIFKRRRVR